jgi:uronate dehydrogenase
VDDKIEGSGVTERVLLTGGAGKVARLLRPRLAQPGRVVRLVDVRTPDVMPPTPDEEVVIASVDDLEAMTRAFVGVRAVIHMGGLSKEAPAPDVLRLNAFGTWCVMEAARLAGARVILASSAHVVGFQSTVDAPAAGIPADAAARPDTLYGWSKAAGEAVGRLYADRYGMDVICLRIGSWTGAPPDLRGLAMWLSPDDGARLVEACLAAHSPGFRIVWGISRNSRRWCSLAEGEELGYFPRDNAEDFADDVIARYGKPDPDDETLVRLGGSWCGMPLGGAGS